MARDHLSIPPTPDSIGPEWLTTALRGSGAVENAKVISIGVTPVAAGSGFVGQAARLHVEYDRKEPGAPATVFAKLSSADTAIREQLRSVGLYETEAGFYRDLATMKTVPMRVPRPYISLYDETTSASILLLEDLGGARFGDHVAGLSPADTRIAVEQLARLHAHFWEKPALKSLGWLRSLTDGASSLVGLVRAMLPQYEQRRAEVLTPGLLKAAKLYAEVLPEYIVRCSGGPDTLVHGDFRADNFAFPDAGGEGGMIVFDWQVSRRAHGARDLAYVLAGSMEIEQRRGLEKSLLDLYHETLLAHGVKGYSAEDLQRDYVMGLGAPLTTSIVEGAMLDFSSERGTELARQASQRLGAALEDHDFVGRLQALAN